MPNRKALYFILSALTTIAIVLAGIIFNFQSNQLKVVFLDVGQGDSILIQQGSKQILIDGGPDGKKVMEKLGEYVPFWDRNIEVVIATHPDEDHISGLTDVMENYSISEVIDNGVSSNSQIYKKYEDIISSKNINHIEGKVGMEIKIGSDAKLDILSPDGTQEKNSPKDTNLSSIVSKLTYQNHTFLFTGDFTAEGELAFLGNPTINFKNGTAVAGINTLNSTINLKADVLKIGHHGSKYATSNEFLDAVKPSEAVISVGKNNRYGHPNAEVLNKLLEHKVNIKRTDEIGDVEYDF
jgi:competence protein ComEC